ncbi:MAG: glycosyltransferase family 4 protein [Thiogranum sp.]
MNTSFDITLLAVLVAMAVSMALIPLMIRLAPALGMMDQPDPRKVHALPIPRVGGVGIVIGALIPMFIWLPWNNLTTSYLAGSVVLLVFGIWDDVRELGHYVKFIGQFIAVLAVVFYGDLYVTHLPFMEVDLAGEAVGRFIAVVGMVGIINAINHSDGLDGLAGGESLLSLGAMVYLASQADDSITSLIAFATIGGVFGFLRFNSHPARVFMGDGGSQFLGFTLAFLALYLTQSSNPALSPALPALLLGLPVVDIIAVLIKRARSRVSLFKASKNHIHHRLLALGFHHYESVMVIYSVQALLVITSIFIPYESDALIIGFYLSVSFLLFAYLHVAESGRLCVRRDRSGIATSWLAGLLRPEGPVMALDYRFMQGLLSVLLLATALFIEESPRDLSAAAGLLFSLLLARLVFGYRAWFLFLRLILFVTVAFCAYLAELYVPDSWVGIADARIALYIVLAVGVVLAVRFSQDEFFRVTPLDYLVLLVVLVLALMFETGYTDASSIKLGLQLIVLFYAVEVVIKHMRSRVNVFTVSALGFLGIVSVRGLF